MAKIKDFEKARKKRLKKRNIRRLSILAAICGIVLLAIGIRNLLSEIPVINMIKTNISLQKQTGEFPIELLGIQQFGLLEIKNNIAVFSETNLYVFDSDGKQVLKTVHGLNDPRYMAFGDEIIYYKPGSSIIHRQSIYGKKTTLDTQKRIVDISVVQNKYIAVASQSEQYISWIEVYDKNEEIVYRMKIDGNEMVSSISFTNDHQGVMFVTYSSENGNIISRVAAYNFNGKLIFSKSIEDILVYSAEYHGNSIFLIADDRTIKLSSSGENLAEYSYENKTLTKFDNTNRNSVVLILSDYGKNKSSTIINLNQQCTVQTASTVSERLQDMYIYGNTEYVLTDSHIIWYSSKGEEQGRITLNDKGLDFIILNGQAYVLSGNQLHSFELKSEEM